MKWFEHLRKFGTMTILSMLVALYLTGIETDAANSKDTVLSNLAKGLTSVTDSEGNEIKNAELLTDEDKYYLQYSKEGNKVSGSSVKDAASNNVGGWEAYVEKGALVEKDAKWIQLDLGGTYPIEVINLKRRMYDDKSNISMALGHSNKPLRYNDTVIVIGNQEDLSDGYVVYYNDEDGSVTLPEGVNKPEGCATGGLVENMAGTYFYMDNTKENGTGYTDIGTTKEARYVRIYSDHPDMDEDLMFMELGVYGYKEKDSVQKPGGKRQTINNENPLMIAAAYSDDQYYLGQEEKVGLQGYNTISGRWDTVADDLKENTVLMMHSNNLRSFSPHYIGQAYLHGYYETCLKEAYEAGAPVMLMLVNASSVPGGTNWCITRDADYHWADLMFRMYPNLEGVFSTENFWSGSIDKVAESVGKYLEIAGRYGGYVVYSEEGTGVFNQLANNGSLRKAVEKYGQSLFYTYKNTGGGDDCLLTQSHIMGSYLAGYTGGFGMLSDSWAWGNNGNGKIYETGNSSMHKNWRPVCAEPEAIYGMQMINTWLQGGVVYTFEFPEVVYGAIDEKSPAYTHVVEPVFRHICNNPGPSRKDLLNSNKTIVYNSNPQNLYSKTTGKDNVLGLFGTSRYESMPSIPTWGTKDEVVNKLKNTAKNEGAAAPVVLDNSDSLLTYGTEEYFKSLYPIGYLGDAFAKEYKGAWYVYNSTVNSKVNQKATLPLKAAEGTSRFSTEIEPHTFFKVEEKGSDTLKISLNNYRIDAEDIIFKNPYGWRWDGSSATGQGVSAAKLTVYRYMAYYNAVNAKKHVENKDVETKNEKPYIDQLSPNDNELRTSTFKITKITEKPSVEVVKGQAPDTDGFVQYKAPVVKFDEKTKTATITIESNGWVDLIVSNLQYEVDPDAVKIEDKQEGDYGEKTNLAKNKEVTGSHDDKDKQHPYSKVTDEILTCGDYDYANFGDVNEAVWLEIDLKGLHKVEELKMHRYFRDIRAYNDTVIMLSPTKAFDADETLVIWNSHNEKDGNRADWKNDEIAKKIKDGTDPLYVETSGGETFPVYGENVHFLNGTKENIPTNEEGKNTFDARYVRVYMNGNTTYENADMQKVKGRGMSNHVIEVQVMGYPNLKEQENYTNLATRSAIKLSKSSSGDRSPSIAIDKVKNDPNKYTDPGANDGGAQWIELDMGVPHDIEKLVLYRYFGDGRAYYNTVVMLSEDKNFSPDSTLVLWNANGKNGGKNQNAVSSWPGNGNGTNENSHTVPEGDDPSYNETRDGKTFHVFDENVKWLNPDKKDPLPKDGEKRFKARYARVYMNGSNKNPSNHVVEIEVYGEEGDFVLQDTEKPERVTEIEVSDVRTNSAVVSFFPSMDNMGVKNYKVQLWKTGDTDKQEMELTQTKYELTGLTPGAEYELTIVAVDNYNNESDLSETVKFTTYNNTDVVVNANKKSGKYATEQDIVLTTALKDGEIYYTLDGNKPFGENNKPSKTAIKYVPGTTISIKRSCVLQAAVMQKGYVWPVSSYFYQIGETTEVDFDAPDAPKTVEVENISATSANVKFTSSSPEVKAFHVYVNGEKKAVVKSEDKVMEAVLEGLKPLTSYMVWVTVEDESGNESVRSKTIEFVTRSK